MSESRPKYATGKDTNHYIVRDFMEGIGGFLPIRQGRYMGYKAWYRGYLIVAIDTHSLSGLFLDWIIYCNNNIKMVEVKTPEALKADRFSDGERLVMSLLGSSAAVVSCDDDLVNLLNDMTR